MHYFVAICGLKLELKVQKCLIWDKIINSSPRVTLEFDRWHKNNPKKLFYATSSFVHNFVAICRFNLELWYRNTQIGAKFVLTYVTLTYDPWPWPFAWTSLLSMVINPENFMMIKWDVHCEKGVTDGWMVWQMDRTILRAACSQLKNCVQQHLWPNGLYPYNPGALTGLIRVLHPTNERWRYFVTTSLIGWAKA